MGTNTVGQLGMGNVSSYNNTIQIPNITGVVDINLGSFDARLLCVL